MTVQELIDELTCLPGDAVVRMAQQPNRPLEYSVDDVVHVIVDGRSVAYIKEGGQIGYLCSNARDNLDW